MHYTPPSPLLSPCRLDFESLQHVSGNTRYVIQDLQQKLFLLPSQPLAAILEGTFLGFGSYLGLWNDHPKSQRTCKQQNLPCCATDDCRFAPC